MISMLYEKEENEEEELDVFSSGNFDIISSDVFLFVIFPFISTNDLVQNILSVNIELQNLVLEYVNHRCGAEIVVSQLPNNFLVKAKGKQLPDDFLPFNVPESTEKRYVYESAENCFFRFLNRKGRILVGRNEFGFKSGFKPTSIQQNEEQKNEKLTSNTILLLCEIGGVNIRKYGSEIILYLLGKIFWLSYVKDTISSYSFKLRTRNYLDNQKGIIQFLYSFCEFIDFRIEEEDLPLRESIFHLVYSHCFSFSSEYYDSPYGEVPNFSELIEFLLFHPHIFKLPNSTEESIEMIHMLRLKSNRTYNISIINYSYCSSTFIFLRNNPIKITQEVFERLATTFIYGSKTPQTLLDPFVENCLKFDTNLLFPTLIISEKIIEELCCTSSNDCIMKLKFLLQLIDLKIISGMSKIMLFKKLRDSGLDFEGIKKCREENMEVFGDLKVNIIDNNIEGEEENYYLEEEIEILETCDYLLKKSNRF